MTEYHTRDSSEVQERGSDDKEDYKQYIELPWYCQVCENELIKKTDYACYDEGDDDSDDDEDYFFVPWYQETIEIKGNSYNRSLVCYKCQGTPCVTCSDIFYYDTSDMWKRRKGSYEQLKCKGALHFSCDKIVCFKHTRCKECEHKVNYPEYLTQSQKMIRHSIQLFLTQILTDNMETELISTVVASYLTDSEIKRSYFGVVRVPSVPKALSVAWREMTEKKS